MTFKFQVGASIVTQISADRNLSGMAVRIITREPGDGTTPELVSREWVQCARPFGVL